MRLREEIPIEVFSRGTCSLWSPKVQQPQPHRFTHRGQDQPTYCELKFPVKLVLLEWKMPTQDFS